MNYKRQGKLYIFEGVDNVGKTTIVNGLCNVLKNSNISYSAYSFPGQKPDTLGALVYDIHHNPNRYLSEGINNISLQMLHVSSHIDLLISCIIPDLRNGKIVILDRSWWSTYAYGIAGGISPEMIKLVIAPEETFIKQLEIGKIFFIKRKQTSSKNKQLLSTSHAYNDIIKAYRSTGLVKVVNNNRNVNDVIDKIVSYILKQNEVQIPVKNSLKKSPLSTSIPTMTRTFNTDLLIKSSIYDTYWKFAFERQNIFFLKLNNYPYPWTDDRILQKYKFTNAYRASDRVSQYLIKNVIYNCSYTTPEDLIFRIVLFKLFNKIETWEMLEEKIGDISYHNFDFEKYDKVLSDQLSANARIYSAAYIMPSGKSTFNFAKKHQNNLSLLEMIMRDGISGKIAKARNLKELYELLLQYPTLGKFLAFQLSIDINYSELCDFSEMSFVIAGPGAQSGIHKCFIEMSGYTYEDIVRYMAERQQEEFQRLGLNFQNLWGRPLQLIDCQNLFCETDKYSRVAHPNMNSDTGRTRIKQLYTPNNSGLIDYFFPPKWNINQNINLE